MDNLDIFASLIEDKAFLSELEGIDSLDELCEKFAQQGVSVTVEEMKEVQKLIAIEKSGGELSEDLLLSVSGGACKYWEAIKDGFKAGYKAGQKFCDWMWNTFGVC